VRRGREYARQINGVFAREPIAAIVAEAKRQLLNRLGERAARVDFVAEIDPELEAEVDRHALLQALQNVLQNAVEAYGAERARLPLRVTARTLRAKSQLELRVADEGVGMLEEERVRMFVPFGSSKSGGTGVGMLVTRKMIEEVHGGELSIESAAGAGTTVTMVVPTRQRGER
jgi:signal transduction histidine kinase